MKQIIVFIAVVFIAYTAGCQDLSVSAFSMLENDMTARTIAPERDVNGDLTALIRVVSTADGFVFEGGSLGIVKAEQKAGEWWLYVPSGARTLTIRHPQLGVLRNYAYPISISSGNVYEMKLIHGTVETIVINPTTTPQPLPEKERTPFEHEMVFVLGGSYMMGCTNEQGKCAENEKPARRVTVRSFQIGKYEVAQSQWVEVMGKNPSIFKACGNCPVESVSWKDTRKFIRKLNRITGKNYRLPTEAEWEYAARGGDRSKNYRFSGSSEVDSIAWHRGNSTRTTSAVGSRIPNELGIYDMSGNVWEWCSDWYGLYTGNSSTNPKGPNGVSMLLRLHRLGAYRVVRGGGWNSSVDHCRLSHRGTVNPGYRSNDRGFRLVLPAP